MTRPDGSDVRSEAVTYQEAFNRRLYHPNRFVWAHRYLPERVRMWSPWWLRHVVAVERIGHDRTRIETGLWPASDILALPEER